MLACMFFIHFIPYYLCNTTSLFKKNLLPFYYRWILCKDIMYSCERRKIVIWAIADRGSIRGLWGAGKSLLFQRSQGNHIIPSNVYYIEQGFCPNLLSQVICFLEKPLHLLLDSCDYGMPSWAKYCIISTKNNCELVLCYYNFWFT